MSARLAGKEKRHARDAPEGRRKDRLRPSRWPAPWTRCETGCSTSRRRSREAIDYVRALRVIGSGLIVEDYLGEPVVAVACAAAERLETVKTIWDEVFEIGRRGS